MPELLTDPMVLIIVAVGAATYALRLGGLLLAERLPKAGPVAAGLERLPALVLLALVVPAVAELGLLGVVAAIAAGATTLLTRSPLAAMGVGAAVVAAARALDLA